MNVYVAASWRTPRQPEVVARLRDVGYHVYDFRDHGFQWEAIDPRWKEWTPREYLGALTHPLARKHYERDMDALKAADVVVMVQPAGRSAAMEFGWAVGQGKPGLVLIADQEPELMVSMAGLLTTDLGAIVRWLAVYAAGL